MQTVHARGVPLRRSLLFVPGAEPRKLEKAREAAADTLLLDLEDSVAPELKREARQHVAAALRAGIFAGREVAVRVNAPGTPYFEEDLQAAVLAGAQAILLPKCETADGVAAVVDAIAALERERTGAALGRVRVLALVESPAGVANAAAIAKSSPRVEALCFGHADFALLMGLAEADAATGVVYHARCALAIAAKACGLVPIDCVHLAVRDETAFRRDVEMGMQLGYEGKLCIHPRQAEIANEVYTPGPEAIAYARRVVEAWQRAEAEGRGVFTLDGRMIDAPLVAVQQRVLERARRAGKL